MLGASTPVKSGCKRDRPLALSPSGFTPHSKAHRAPAEPPTPRISDLKVTTAPVLYLYFYQIYQHSHYFSDQQWLKCHLPFLLELALIQSIIANNWQDVLKRLIRPQTGCLVTRTRILGELEKLGVKNVTHMTLGRSLAHLFPEIVRAGLQ